ncbi:MAG: type II secretion system GspH family protein [Planctomycetes bacterium]|nr:type II secretion system GspH family protein [Planctomycetota bacterium]
MRKANRGFSLVEMLVVVAIILIMVTGSISIMSVFMRGQGIKQAGRIIQGQFMNARQKATSEKTVYFLVFDTQKNVMRLYRDVDPDGPTAPKTYDRVLVLVGADADAQEGDEHPLPKNIEFACNHAGWGSKSLTSTPPYNVLGSSFYITFYPDGTCVLPIVEKAYDPDGTSTGTTQADLVLVQAGQTSRLFLDIGPSVGKIRKQAFRTQ